MVYTFWSGESPQGSGKKFFPQPQRTTVPIDELDLPAAEDFAMAVQDRELLERIESYVSGLDPGIQAVFRLRLYGEKSFPEIAAILDQSESAVKSQYYRLLGRLRKEFDPNG